MVLKLSKHAQMERFDRASYIIDTIGFGRDVVISGYAPDPEVRGVRKMEITDTGVCLVLDEKEEFVITFYIASMALAKAINGGKVLPKALYKKISANEKIRAKCP